MNEYAIVTVMKGASPALPAPIELFVSLKSIGARMELHNFIDHVLAEMGTPALLLTKAQLAKRLVEACDVVVGQMKRETILVAMGPPEAEDANA